MDLFPRPKPSRPQIVPEGVAVELEIEGRLYSVVITDRVFGDPPAGVGRRSAENAWLKSVQYNMDVVRAAAERKLKEGTDSAALILLGPDDLTWSIGKD